MWVPVSEMNVDVVDFILPVRKHSWREVVKMQWTGRQRNAGRVRLLKHVCDVITESTRVTQSRREILRRFQHRVIRHEIRRANLRFVLFQLDRRPIRCMTAGNIVIYILLHFTWKSSSKTVQDLRLFPNNFGRSKPLLQMIINTFLRNKK